MALSTLIVPVLLTFTACFALGKRVDVYSALTKGAEEGLTVLLHILPSLIALLSAVYMFRASGAMEALGALLAPARINGRSTHGAAIYATYRYSLSRPMFGHTPRKLPQKPEQSPGSSQYRANRAGCAQSRTCI